MFILQPISHELVHNKNKETFHLIRRGGAPVGMKVLPGATYLRKLQWIQFRMSEESLRASEGGEDVFLMRTNFSEWIKKYRAENYEESRMRPKLSSGTRDRCNVCHLGDAKSSLVDECLLMKRGKGKPR